MSGSDRLVTRRASVVPSSIDAARRTAAVVWSTGARVVRGFFERFYEELSLEPAHVRMTRLQSGAAPLLAAHEGGSLDAVIGVVESASLEPGKGTARVRFAQDDPVADRVWSKVEQGIIRNISVGYKVHKYEKRADGDEQIPTMIAVDWEPFELSVVAMGADAGARFRAADVYEESDDMRPMVTSNADAERDRVSGILRAVRIAKLDEPELAERLISDGVTLAEAQAIVLDRMAAHEPLGPRVGRSGVVVTVHDGGADFRAAASDALVLRAGIGLAKPHAAARDITPSTHEIARVALSRAGIAHTGLSSDALITRAMTTSDFPLILADAIHKSVRQGYETEPSSHRLWVRSATVTDFRDQNRPILGSAPGLLQVLEHGEYTEGSMTEDSTSYRVAKYGRIVALTWEVLVNDDLNAFLRLQPALGQAARRLEADLVYALFALNAGAGPTMQDNDPLFHINHVNLATGAALDAALLQAGRTLLRRQTALGGGALSLVPRYLIIPPEYESVVEVILAAATRMITTTSAVTPSWIGDLVLVVEPRLTTGAVYLAATSEQIDTVELGRLTENADGPVLQTETEFVRDISRWKIRHVCGVKVLDWRGMVKLPVSP